MVFYRVSCVFVMSLIILSTLFVVASPREQLMKADALDDLIQKLVIYNKLCTCNHTAVRIEALLRLAVTHHYGYYDMPKDAEKAVAYWQVLAQQTINRPIQVQAHEILGDYYRDGYTGFPANTLLARRHYMLARDQCPDTDLDIKGRAVEKLVSLEK
jgi:TPR repeat protein